MPNSRPILIFYLTPRRDNNIFTTRTPAYVVTEFLLAGTHFLRHILHGPIDAADYHAKQMITYIIAISDSRTKSEKICKTT